ncbi:hypothetical protein BBM86_22695 [Vibrio parahaemolyticus]|nr:hypothetical protein [Vibrio vulnificus]EJS4061507.1 hypothetical protein [Vibrio parahaemolyticus]OEB77171.1 hypothetical protein BBM86_22695 [Vibrio parahaemolyticus]RZR39768.1 hypothetical protein D8T58_22785 [Vibrio vulnificus]HDY8229883.1 hypothetical protein [Vibrio vulnificus]
MEKDLTKVVVGILSLMVTTAYVIGFLYDAAFLEKLGLAHYEMIGDSLEYLSIGGMYLFFNFASGLAFFMIVGALIGCGYMPLKRFITAKANGLSSYVDLQSLPYILIGSLPVLFVALVPVVNDANELAAQHLKSEANTQVCKLSDQQCFNGIVVKYRDGKLVFLSKDKSTYNRVFVIPEKNIAIVQQLS